MGTVNSGMASGDKELDRTNVSGVKNSKYVLVYTQWNGYFTNPQIQAKPLGC